MKRLFLILILTFSFQSLTKADDIKDFEIEGMSVGDSLLNYFSNAEIENAFDESSEDRIYIVKNFIEKNKFKNYEALQISYKATDKKMIITSIGGVITFANKIDECKNKMYQIDIELTNLFPTVARKDWGKYDNHDKTGHYFPITFDFDDSSMVMVSCHDWNEQTKINDNLKVTIAEANYASYVKNQNL
jgi:hypothetical protein